MTETETETVAPDEPIEVPEPDGTPEPDEHDEPAPDDEPEQPAEDSPPADTPPAPPTEKDMEAVFKGAEKIRKDVAGRVGRLFGDEASALIECPMCSELAPGWIWDPAVAPLPDERRDAVLIGLGFTTPAQFKPHRSVHRCDACDGQGKVSTGSKVAGYEVMDCPECLGKGWTGVHAPSAAVTYTNGDEQDAGLTGPLHYSPPADIPDFSDDPSVRDLKSRGFLVVPPPNYTHA